MSVHAPTSPQPTPKQEQAEVSQPVAGWRELWLKEDWWSIWLGLGIVFLAYGLFAHGSSLKWLAVTPPKWSTGAQLQAHFGTQWLRYVAQFAAWLAVLSLALAAMGQSLKRFVPAFAFLYAWAVLIFVVGQWTEANRYNLEAPLVALALGLLISNLMGLPRWMDAGFRVEFFVKIGIVLLGATLPFSLILWAGPTAIFQASLVSISTFLVIFFVARKLGLEKPLAATLGAGGAVCGVSAAIAIAGAVGAKKEHAPVAITVVIFWAIVMIFALPLVSQALHLPAGVAGAWIGTSEFADAAGFAAAQAYGDMVGAGGSGIEGSPEQAVWAFTLMKVVGRDVWIGIWAVVLAWVSITRWETQDLGRQPNVAQIWWRFPKFVLGFAIASVFISWVARDASLTEFNKVLVPNLVAPIKDLRTWAFIFCFFSIGLTTRFKDLAHAGTKPFAAFSVGVVVNVVLGFVLSAVVFADHWASLVRS